MLQFISAVSLEETMLNFDIKLPVSILKLLSGGGDIIRINSDLSSASNLYYLIA